MEKKDWVTTAQVAEMLGVSPGKARKVIVEENLTIFTVGNRWRILREEVELLVERVRERGSV